MLTQDSSSEAAESICHPNLSKTPARGPTCSVNAAIGTSDLTCRGRAQSHYVLVLATIYCFVIHFLVCSLFRALLPFDRKLAQFVCLQLFRKVLCHLAKYGIINENHLISSIFGPIRCNLLSNACKNQKSFFSIFTAMFPAFRQCIICMERCSGFLKKLARPHFGDFAFNYRLDNRSVL